MVDFGLDFSHKKLFLNFLERSVLWGEYCKYEKKAKISLDPPLIDEPIKTQADMIDSNIFFKGFNKKSIDEGLKQTVQWYKKNYL